MPSPSEIQVIEDQLLEGLTTRLEAALEIVASSDAMGRLGELVEHCEDAVALARAGMLLLDG